MGIRRETAEVRAVPSPAHERKDRTEGQVKDGVSQDALRNLLRRKRLTGRRGPRKSRQEHHLHKSLSKALALLPGPPMPPSVAELPQDSTALSTLGTAGEKRVDSKPPLRASGGSSSTSLASLRLPDWRGRRGPGKRRGITYDLRDTEFL